MKTMVVFNRCGIKRRCWIILFILSHSGCIPDYPDKPNLSNWKEEAPIILQEFEQFVLPEIFQFEDSLANVSQRAYKEGYFNIIKRDLAGIEKNRGIKLPQLREWFRSYNGKIFSEGEGQNRIIHVEYRTSVYHRYNGNLIEYRALLYHSKDRTDSAYTSRGHFHIERDQPLGNDWYWIVWSCEGCGS